MCFTDVEMTRTTCLRDPWFSDIFSNAKLSVISCCRLAKSFAAGTLVTTVNLALKIKCPELMAGKTEIYENTWFAPFHQFHTAILVSRL